MKDSFVKELAETWEVLPSLDKEGFISEGLGEVAHQIILALCSPRSLESLQQDFEDFKKSFSNMTLEQKTFFCDNLKNHLETKLSTVEGYEEFNRRFESLSQTLLATN